MRRRSADQAGKGSRHATGRRRAPRRLLIAAVLVVLGVAAFVALRNPSRRAPIAYTAEYDEALRLSTSGQHVASLPHYARAAGRMARVWVFHFNYSSALYNAALEVGERSAMPTPRTRSSSERVQLLARSLQEITAAEALAASPADALLARAQMLQIWGLDWDDGLARPRSPARRVRRARHGGVARALMQHPENPDSAAPLMAQAAPTGARRPPTGQACEDVALPCRQPS